MKVGDFVPGMYVVDYVDNEPLFFISVCKIKRKGWIKVTWINCHGAI